VPVFLTLFLMGVILSTRDEARTLSYTAMPELHWVLAIILFVVVGASLPWRDFTWLAGAQAIGLLLARAAAKLLAMAASGGALPMSKRLLTGIGIQPLSATALFMAFEISRLYPDSGNQALRLAFFAAAIMDIAGPLLCRYALNRAGETAAEKESSGGIP
jgi:Kef-type K+ transport system membrane component KefB